MLRFLHLTVLLIMMATLTPYQISLADQGGATLVGRITFNGEIPPPRVIKVNRDWKFCGDTITVQPLTVHKSSHSNIRFSNKGISPSYHNMRNRN